MSRAKSKAKSFHHDGTRRYTTEAQSKSAFTTKHEGTKETRAKKQAKERKSFHRTRRARRTTNPVILYRATGARLAARLKTEDPWSLENAPRGDMVKVMDFAKPWAVLVGLKFRHKFGHFCSRQDSVVL